MHFCFRVKYFEGNRIKQTSWTSKGEKERKKERETSNVETVNL
jgi:hypothetical protein